MKTIDIGEDFFPRLTNRDTRQRDGKYTAVEFREKYLSELDKEEAWKDDSLYINLDFKNVSKMGPSWANEVFAYFTKYSRPEKVLDKIRLINISRVKKSIIKQELDSGYSQK